MTAQDTDFGAGSHERVFSASLAGAAVFSDFSAFYGEIFDEDREIAMFRWRDLPAGIGALADLAGDCPRAFALARAAKAKVAAGHTWDRRIETVLAAAAAARGVLENRLTCPANS